MRPWALIPTLVLSFASFVVALFPRYYSTEYTAGEPFRLIMWPKLLRFPLFWCGGGLLALVVVQALNPAWEYQSDGRTFWMRGIAYNSLLPAGVNAPFEVWNQWRMLLIYASAWFLVCAIWVGLTQRRGLHVLLMVLAANGLILTSLGVAQRIWPNGAIFWLYESPNPQFFATFIYKNHAGIYLALMLAVVWGLAGVHYLRGLRRMHKSDPSVLLAFFAVGIAASIFVSGARGATLITAVFMLIGFVAYGVHQFRLPRESRRPIVSLLLVIIIVVCAKPGLDALGAQQAIDRIRYGITRREPSLQWREQATAGALEMLGENWKTGVGAGAFRFLFPIYQYRHPELMTRFGQRIYWEHAHNDIVQFPIELGIAGTLMILIAFAALGRQLARHRFWRSPVSFSLVTMLLLVLVYAWWDFPFQNTAVLATYCCLWTVATAWARPDPSDVG